MVDDDVCDAPHALEIFQRNKSRRTRTIFVSKKTLVGSGDGSRVKRGWYKEHRSGASAVEVASPCCQALPIRLLALIPSPNMRLQSCIASYHPLHSRRGQVEMSQPRPPQQGLVVQRFQQGLQCILRTTAAFPRFGCRFTSVKEHASSHSMSLTVIAPRDIQTSNMSSHNYRSPRKAAAPFCRRQMHRG